MGSVRETCCEREARHDRAVRDAVRDAVRSSAGQCGQGGERQPGRAQAGVGRTERCRGWGSARHAQAIFVSH